MLLTNVVEKLKTHILCSVTFSRKPCRLWDNMEKYCRAGQITENCGVFALHACWIIRAINTLRICIIYCFSTATIFARKRFNVSLWTKYIARLNKLCMMCLCPKENFSKNNVAKWCCMIIWGFFWLKLQEFYFFPSPQIALLWMYGANPVTKNLCWWQGDL